METYKFTKTEKNKALTENIKYNTPITREIHNYLKNLTVKTQETSKSKKNITNENSNHFLVNSEELPKGLTITTLH